LLLSPLSTWLRVLATGLLLVVSASGVARASDFDLFGVHPIGMAEVSARVAAAEDGSACFYNPGGLSLGHGYQFDVSANSVLSRLEMQGERYGIDDPLGGTITVAASVPLEGALKDRIRVGVAARAMASGIMHLKLRDRDSLFYPYYDNRSQRLVAIPAVSVRVLDRVGLGLGFNTLAGVEGPVDIREGQSRTLEPRIVQEAGTVVRWIAGVRIDWSERVRFGITYRQSFGVPLTIATRADIAGTPLTFDITKAEAFYDPAAWTLGIRFIPVDQVAFELDASRQRWSSWEGPVLGIDTTASALSLSSTPSERVFRDTYSIRLGAAWKVKRSETLEMSLHLGTGYETPMIDVSVPHGEANLADGAKRMSGVGWSVRFPQVFGRGLRMSLGVQMHQVGKWHQDKVVCKSLPCPSGTVAGPDAADPSTNIGNRGYPSLNGSGSVFVGAFGVGGDL